MSASSSFWYKPQQRFLQFLLSPVAKCVAYFSARRMRCEGWVAPVPVICCGNLTVGGTGKTTVVLDLMKRLQAQGIEVHALTRGYKGRIKATTRVDTSKHTVKDVGDEALLLAACGPTWVGGDRSASAQMAVKAGAQCLIMDDGFQNPSLHKTFSLVVIDGVVGLGNENIIPAGPLREPVAQGLGRANAVLVIGHDRTNFLEKYKAILAKKIVMRASLATHVAQLSVDKNKSYIAFAGLGRPEKFFEGLAQTKISVVRKISFPDHYFYKKKDLQKLLDFSKDYHAQLLTTPKDMVRLPQFFRQHVTAVGVSLTWDDENILSALLQAVMTGKIT